MNIGGKLFFCQKFWGTTTPWHPKFSRHHSTHAGPFAEGFICSANIRKGLQYICGSFCKILQALAIAVCYEILARYVPIYRVHMNRLSCEQDK
jgi:hypothetical protein